MHHDTLTVRTAQASDLAALDLLFSTSYPALLKADYPPSLLVTAIPLIARANPRLIASGTFYVVTDASDEIVGAGGWTRAAPPGFQATGGVGNIRHVVTDKDRTRQGIGARLMRHILETASTAGLKRLDCLSTRTAVPYYSASGFQVLGPISVPLAPGIDFPAIRMQRLL